ncbi:hypothetical protein Tco_0848797 [Tanacetum coccineum]
MEAMNPTHVATKSHVVVNCKIFQQGQRSIYQIMRKNGADTVYMSFGAMIKDFTKEDLIELYRLVMQKYGTNRPEDAYDIVLWSDLRTMFDPPLNEDVIWSLPLQQKMVSWRYYDKCAVHCLTLEACTIYMLVDRKYPLSKDACQVMLNMKLQGGAQNEVCYQLLKIIERHQELTSPRKTALVKTSQIRLWLTVYQKLYGELRRILRLREVARMSARIALEFAPEFVYVLIGGWSRLPPFQYQQSRSEMSIDYAFNLGDNSHSHSTPSYLRTSIQSMECPWVDLSGSGWIMG